jgi:hypothetical protein
MKFAAGKKRHKAWDVTMATVAICFLQGKTVLRVLLALSINHVSISFKPLGRFS